MRVLIFGNSGSGKSFYAKRLASDEGIPHLDLDSVVWEPKRIAVLRDINIVKTGVLQFAESNLSWVIEGCYGELIEALLGRCTELVFMNPGEAVCLENNRRRPLEPHKYDSQEVQDGMLPQLLAWVSDYYVRDGAWSYAFHLKVFDEFEGPKRETH